MTIKTKIVFSTALAVCVLDQITKGLVVRSMPLGLKVTVWENFFDLVHVRNRGAAFGVLAQWESQYRDVFFYLLFVLALVFLISFLRQMPGDKKGSFVPVGLIFGGAIGNVLDRLFRGSVVDFLSFHWYDKEISWNILGYFVQLNPWPAFNVADSAISAGVVWLLGVMLLQPKVKEVPNP